MRARWRISGAGDQQRDEGHSGGACESPLALCGSAQQGSVFVASLTSQKILTTGNALAMPPLKILTMPKHVYLL